MDQEARTTRTSTPHPGWTAPARTGSTSRSAGARTRRLGHPPEAFPEHRAEYDFTEADRMIPHPVYVAQSWISIVNPGPATAGGLRTLLTEAHPRAGRRIGA